MSVTKQDSLPFIVVTHNRLSGLQNLLDFIEKSPLKIRLIIADMKSTYPPMVDFLDSLGHTQNIEVIRLENIGPRSLYFLQSFRNIVGRKGFFLADGDLDYSEVCPNVLQTLIEVSKRYPGMRKVGCALKLSDLPMDTHDLEQKSEIIKSGEKRNWSPLREVEKGIFLAPIDTTLAYYPRIESRFFFWPALRLGGVNTLRHSPWYEDDSALTTEQKWYLDNQRKDISTVGGRQLSSNNDKEILFVDRFHVVVKLLLKMNPVWGSRIIKYLIFIKNKDSYISEIQITERH
jgi:hypothetical protein